MKTFYLIVIERIITGDRTVYGPFTKPELRDFLIVHDNAFAGRIAIGIDVSKAILPTVH